MEHKKRGQQAPLQCRVNFGALLHHGFRTNHEGQPPSLHTINEQHTQQITTAQCLEGQRVPGTAINAVPQCCAVPQCSPGGLLHGEAHRRQELVDRPLD